MGKKNYLILIGAIALFAFLTIIGAEVPIVQLQNITQANFYNSTYESTYNSTYATYDSTYNSTYAGYDSTYNATYDTWAYNQSFNQSYDKRAATLIVCANDSLHKYACDYRCDGIADDVEINSAIGNLTKGGSVVLMDGIFNINDTINIILNSISLIGQGKGTKIKEMAGAGYGNGVMIINVVDKKGIKVSDLYLYGYDLIHTPLYSIYFENVTNSIIENVWFEHNIEPLTIVDSSFINVKSCFFQSGRIKFSGTNDFQFSGNTISKGSIIGLDIYDSYNILISNNIITNTTIGINLDNIIFGGRVSSKNIIVGNIISFNILGIEIGGQADDNIVMNNLIANNSIGGVKLTVEVDSGGHTNNNIISSNRIAYNGYGINISSGVAGTMVYGNNLYGNLYSLINDGINTTIIGNYPGGASMEIQTAQGQFIKMQPEGVLTATISPGNYNIYGNITINDSIKDANSEISFQFKNGNIYEWL